jgi:tetratricopeptide (TPR) repeat protein
VHKAVPGEEAPEVRCEEEFIARPPIEADLKEPNPKRALQITLGTLVIAAFVAVAYLWSQLQPAPAVVATPLRSGLPGPAVAHASQQGHGTVTGAAPAMQAMPQPPALANEESRPVPSKPDTRAKRTPGSPNGGKQKDVVSTADRAPTRIHPRVESGYVAYQSGDLATAYAEYQQALREEPANRDALLGLAAIDTQTERPRQAEAHYRRLLQSDPRDPEAGVLHFALGNLYAQQERWAEAQQAYLKAQAADAGNPDCAFNLAVSLEHLHRPAAALEYYGRALELAARRAARFSPDSAHQRMQQLLR